MAKNYEFENLNKRIDMINRDFKILENRKKAFNEVKFHIVELPDSDIKVIVHFLIRFLMDKNNMSLEDVLERND